MARYMLDTDTCSYIMKRSSPPVLRRLQAVPVADVCMSVVTKSEVLDFPDAAASHYAEIRADLKKRGALIGASDLWIAAHARSLGLKLVTNNTAEFGRVKGLAIENWALPGPRSRGRAGPGP